MKLKEVVEVLRPLVAVYQWSEDEEGVSAPVGTRARACIECSTGAPDHLMSCALAQALKATAPSGACETCWCEANVHAFGCPERR